MQRFAFQFLVVCLAGASFASACDTTKYTKDATECTKGATTCSSDAGADTCALMKCSMTSYECVFKAVADASCCDTMGASLDASKKAWDDAIKAYGDQLKDCDMKWNLKCGGGGADHAASTRISAGIFAVIAALMISNTM